MKIEDNIIKIIKVYQDNPYLCELIQISTRSINN